MRRQVFAKFLVSGLVVVLIGANCIILLPMNWSIAPFVRPVVRLGALIVERVDADPLTLCVADHTGALVHRMPSLPLPSLQALLDRRRVRNVIDHGKLAVFVRIQGKGEESCIAVQPTCDVWEPDSVTTLRFILKDVLRLPSGRHQIWAILYADSPWGDGQDGSPTFIDAGKYNDWWNRPVLPGTVFLWTVRTQAIEVVIDDSGQPQKNTS